MVFVNIIGNSDIIDDYTDPVFKKDGSNEVIEQPDEKTLYDSYYMCAQSYVNFSNDYFNFKKLIKLIERLKNVKMYPGHKFANTVSFKNRITGNKIILIMDMDRESFDRKYTGFERNQSAVKDIVELVHDAWPGHEDEVYEYYDITPVFSLKTVRITNAPKMEKRGYHTIKRLDDKDLDGLDAYVLVINGLVSTMISPDTGFRIPDCRLMTGLFNFTGTELSECYKKIKKFSIGCKVIELVSTDKDGLTVYGLMTLAPDDDKYYVFCTYTEEDFEILKNKIL